MIADATFNDRRSWWTYAVILAVAVLLPCLPVRGKPPTTGAEKRTALAQRVADFEASWGEPLLGLRMRLTTPAGTEYRRGAPLPLQVEMQNVSDGPIPYADLHAKCRIKVHTEAGDWLGVARSDVAISPWERARGSLARNDIVRWQVRFDRLRLNKPAAAGSAVEVRVSVPRQIEEPGKLPRTSYSKPVVLKLIDALPALLGPADALPPLLSSDDVSDRWTEEMDLVYREVPGLGPEAARAIHIDGQGLVTMLDCGSPGRTVTRLDRNDGDLDLYVANYPSPGRTVTTLDRNRLDALAARLRQMRVWELSMVGADIGGDDEPEMRVSLAYGGVSVVGDYPMHVVRNNPTLTAFEAEMKALIEDAVKAEAAAGQDIRVSPTERLILAPQTVEPPLSENDRALRDAMQPDPSFGEGPRDKPRQRTAITTWMAFLERENLTREQQVFAWWRIGQLAGGNFDLALGETADLPLAERAFVKVHEIAEDLISNETLNAATFYGTLPGKPHDRTRRLAIAYRWLFTRTDAMVEQSATRINHNGYGINGQLMRGGMRMDTVGKKRVFLHSQLSEFRESLSQRITREIRTNTDPKAIDTLLKSLEDVAEPDVMKEWNGIRSPPPLSPVDDSSTAEEKRSAGRPVATRKLWGKEHSEAVSARDRVDRMRAGLEKRRSAARREWRKAGNRGPLPTSDRFEGQATEMVRAYRDVIDRYPHTEIAADCALHLAGFYQCQGKFDEAAQVSAETATEFADTPEGIKAVFNTGLIHLQARHDPAEASKWFARVTKPAKPAGALYDETDKFYLSAQEQLIKCELMLGLDGQAEERAKKLKQVFPQYAGEVARSYQTELAERDSMRGAAEPASAAPRNAAGVPSVHPTGEGQASSAALEGLVSQLGRLKAGAEKNQAVASLARQGDAAVAEIARQVEWNRDFGWLHTTVRVLKAVNSEESRAILRRIAVGELAEQHANPNIESWAAQALIGCNPSEAWALLTSTTPQVLVVALVAVDGQPVDEKRMALLETCLESEDALVCWRTAAVMAGGCTGKLASEAVDAIGQALTVAAGRPDADAPYPRAGGATFVEMYSSPYIGSLALARVDNQRLHELAERMEGRARDAVLVALARRDDKSVHDELIRLAQEPEATLFRAWAARALGEIGTAEDLPLLRTLAKTDPLVREGLLPATHGVGARGPTHPVREAAEDAIRTLEKKSKEPQSPEPTTRPPETAGTGPALEEYDEALRARLARTQQEEPLEQLYGALEEAEKGGQAVTEDVLRQIAAVREAGHDPAAGLRKLYDRGGSVQQRTIILLALQEVGTPQALAALKEIALKPGRTAHTLGPRAVRAMAALTSDPDEISELLVSESPRARDEAAMALSGKELTAVSVRRLGELLRSDSWVVHNLVGTAFATDRSTTTVDRKVELLLAALPQLERLKDAQKIDVNDGSTGLESALNSYVFALCEMLEADEVLRRRLSGASGGSLEHTVLALALALRKDKIAYPWVLQIAREHKSGFVRFCAVAGLGRVGSAQDIRFLESLVADDPYTRKVFYDDRGDEAEQVIYPVRLAAKDAIAALRNRTSADGSDKKEMSFVAGTARDDPFLDKLRFLEEQDVKKVGRDAKVAGYEQLLREYPAHPERAKAMLLLASLWQITNPKLKLKPNPQVAIRWLREACEAASEGSPDWFEARFRLVGHIKMEKPDEARRILHDLIEQAPGPVIEVRALYYLQVIAIREKDFDKAEEICRTLQHWDADPDNLPEGMLEKGKVFSWMQWSASSMMTAWAKMDLPKAERAAKIAAFGEIFDPHPYIQIRQERALESLERRSSPSRKENSTH